MSWRVGDICTSVRVVACRKGYPYYSCGLYTVTTRKRDERLVWRAVASGPEAATAAKAFARAPDGWRKFVHIDGVRNGAEVTAAECRDGWKTAYPERIVTPVDGPPDQIPAAEYESWLDSLDNAPPIDGRDASTQ